jgi:hypothetical protein
MRLKPLAALVALATVLAGCSVAPESLASPGPSASSVAVLPAPLPTPDGCPELPAEPAPAEVLPADLDEATRAAIKGRAEYGLRRDLPWVRLVAADPRASTAFGFPLLPEEEQSLFARHDPAEAVQRVLMAYGHEDELGGLYIDNALGGTVVVLWTANIEAHAATIRARLPECHPVIFKGVRWSEAELRRWQDKISADWAWMATIPADPRGVGADTARNVVTVDISSANPNAAAIIVAHYNAPPGMIRVLSDGTGAALLPSGTVKGVVVRRDGKRLGDVGSLMIQEAPGGPPGWCGAGDIGFGVMPNGAFEYPCKVGRRVIQVAELGNELPHKVLGEARVDVPANGVVFVRIEIDPPAQP